jgi:hypothetical protein
VLTSPARPGVSRDSHSCSPVCGLCSRDATNGRRVERHSKVHIWVGTFRSHPARRCVDGGARHYDV